jgi:sugar phosphate isomerase/epimerase
VRVGASVGDDPGVTPAVAGSEIEFVELSIGEGQLPVGEVDGEALRETLETAGLDLTVHLPYAQSLVTPVPEYNEALRRYVERLLDRAAGWGAELAVLHATARNPVADDQRQTLRSQMRALDGLARDRGVQLCFENVGHTAAGFALGTLGAAAEDADVAVCFDTGHAFIEGRQTDAESFVRNHGDQITHVHAHDVRVRGDSHIPVGSGEIDFESLCGRLADRGFDGSVAVEVFTDDPHHLCDSARRVAACFEP